MTSIPTTENNNINNKKRERIIIAANRVTARQRLFNDDYYDYLDHDSSGGSFTTINTVKSTIKFMITCFEKVPHTNPFTRQSGVVPHFMQPYINDKTHTDGNC